MTCMHMCNVQCKCAGARKYMYMYMYLYDKGVSHCCARSDVGLENVTKLLDRLKVLKHRDILKEELKKL